jgi:uncharacterized protein
MLRPLTATIRFYAELNDFLAPDRRQRDVRYEFLVPPAVKDVIEAFGVPHTEVDLVLANGISVGFGYRLADGDHISVYPTFERLDIAGLTAQPEPLREVRFVADGHLGTLARYLRLLGFDTRCDTEWSDETLATTSVSERRILLTRDRDLLKRRAVTHGLFLRHDDPRHQIVDVVRRLHLGKRLHPFTRCMACNGLLKDVDKDLVQEQLQPRTQQQFDEFRSCRDCHRVYWKGSHHRRLLELVAYVRAQAAAPTLDDASTGAASSLEHVTNGPPSMPGTGGTGGGV